MRAVDQLNIFNRPLVVSLPPIREVLNPEVIFYIKRSKTAIACGRYRFAVIIIVIFRVSNQFGSEDEALFL